MADQKTESSIGKTDLRFLKSREFPGKCIATDEAVAEIRELREERQKIQTALVMCDADFDSDLIESDPQACIESLESIAREAYREVFETRLKAKPRPMSKAPTDGTWILAMSVDHHEDWPRWEIISWLEFECMWIDASGGYNKDSDYIHWLPLPPKQNIDDVKAGQNDAGPSS